MLALRMVMPSNGDMELLGQEGGIIDLEPVFFGNESMGPHLQVVSGKKIDGKFVVERIISRSRLKLKVDGKLLVVKVTKTEAK